MIYCFTGDGKGKTTAALGIALRALGHDMKTGIIQFMKGTWPTGETEAIKQIDGIDIFQTGKGFYKIMDDQFSEKEHRAAAKKTLQIIEQKIKSDKYDILVLDEINVAIETKLINAEEVLEILKKAPEKMHFILTGRNAPKALIQIADLVTEMMEIKHPFHEGIKAKKGLDF